MFFLRAVLQDRHYHSWKTVKSGRALARLELCGSLCKAVWTIPFAPSLGEGCSSLILIEGDNQRRLFQFLGGDLFALPVVEATAESEVSFFAGVPNLYGVGSALRLSLWLAAVAVFGKTKHLLLFYKKFYSAIDEGLRGSACSFREFYTFNEKTLISASLVASLNRAGVRTICIQHGVIFRKYAYFPSNVSEFWAWGKGASRFFSSRARTTFKAVGRFRADRKNRVLSPVNLQEKSAIRIVVAVGYRWAEIEGAIHSLREVQCALSSRQVDAVIKLHPSTKLGWLLLLKLRLKGHIVQQTKSWLEGEIDRYDILLTKNSTLALDFLLHGRAVLIIGEAQGAGPLRFALTTEVVLRYGESAFAHLQATEYARLRDEILQEYLNV